MGKSSASTRKSAGIALMVIGIGLAIWAEQLSGSLGSQITQTVTGSATDKVMLLYIGGATGFVAGLFLFLKK
ncbi:MAG: DUF3185 family protein [Desulfurivibrionaceae bacterium]